MSAAQRRKNPDGDGPTTDAGQGNCSEKDSGYPPTQAGQIPIGEIKQDAGNEARFCDPEQETQDVKHRWRSDECYCSREQSPCDHDAGNPEPRPNPMQYDVAGHFEQYVPQKKDACTEAIHCFTELQFTR